ncbi:MAG: CRISPR-associated helicase Cas3' [Candidatus Heimdallarchaeota archaeon]|nr:CRISPR-associated helicase Cas3' [Candidatus Heimdallarchaeota archaeon]
MSSSSSLKSHPDTYLEDHLEAVGSLAKDLLAAKKLSSVKLYSQVAYLLGISHDFAKATRFFQDLLAGKGRSKKANHSFLSALFSYWLVQEYLQITDQWETFEHLPAIAFIVISRHHSNLTNLWGEANSLYEKLLVDADPIDLKEQLQSIPLEEIIEIYDRLFKKEKLPINAEDIGHFVDEIVNSEKSKPAILRKIARSLKKLSKLKDLEKFFEILLFFSVLIDADKLLAAGINSVPPRIESIPEDFIDNYKKENFGPPKTTINKTRERAYNETLQIVEDLDLDKDNRILSLNLPTGCGKTLTGLAAALLLRKRIQKHSKGQLTPRIIYSLPFLSIIDQNSQVIEEIIQLSDEFANDGETPGNLFLKHHHLAEIAYKKQEPGAELFELPQNQAFLLIESWHSEIIITTFIQLFHSLISYRNRTSRKFHNIVNSIIILDEIQSIPNEYWEVIKEILNWLAKKYHCWIIIMTATIPLIFSSEETKKLVAVPEDYFAEFDRFNFSIDLEPKQFEEFKPRILKEITQGDKDLMVILNTIRSCKELYSFLKEELTNIYPNAIIDKSGVWQTEALELYCLSTHILPIHRLKKINRIKEEKKKRKKKKVIVTTQLVEAGVDISVDKIVRDFAPLDCLIQAAGRCNRNNSPNKGEINIVQLQDERTAFSNYIYDRTLTFATEEILKKTLAGKKKGIISEKIFTAKATRDYYWQIEKKSSKEKSTTLLSQLKMLRFGEIAQSFQLIKDQATIQLFIELNAEAKKMRENLEEELQEIRGYQKKMVRLKYRKAINDYSLGLNIFLREVGKLKNLPEITGMNYYRYVLNDKLDSWYQRDIGFNPTEEASIGMRII